MSARDWPTEFSGNPYTLAKLDPEAPPVRYQVTTWSGVFHSGGSVTVEAYLKDEKRVTLATIRIDENRSVVSERAHLEDLLKQWKRRGRINWRNLVNGARDEIAARYRHDIAEATEWLTTYGYATEADQ